MSENKYIIDKDSLTGIADAVRDKLGNGAAITDEDAGYYPVPVKKLGYSETASTASYSGPGTGYAGDNTIYVRPISELVNICGIRPSYIKVTVTNSTGFKNNDIIFRYTNASMPESSRVDSVGFDAKHTAILSIPNDIEDCYIAYGAYYSTYSSQYSYRSTPPYDVVFLDSNQNEIDISEYSGDSFVVTQWGTTEPFLTETSFEKIPYSIDDIQDKITNYLGKSSLLIGHEGLSYGYLAQGNSSFYSDIYKNKFLTFIPLHTGQKIGFCIGETVSNILRAGFFSGKTYNNFSQYVENSFSNSQIYSDGISVTGGTELSGDGLLKRFYYTAPSDGMLVVSTSNENKLAFLHVWEVTE